MKKLVMMLAAMIMTCIMAVPVFAAEMVQSIELKPAPEAVEKEGGAVVEIFDSDDNIVKRIGRSQLIITPVSQADNAFSKEVGIILKKSHKILVDAQKLSDVCVNLAEAAMQTDSTLDIDDLVVRDVFDISILYDQAGYIPKMGDYIRVTFDLGLDRNEPVILLHFDGSRWEAMGAEHVTREADGRVTITLTSLSPVAFVVRSSAATAVKSPQTSDDSLDIWLLCGSAAMMLAAGCFAAYFVGRRRGRAAQ